MELDGGVNIFSDEGYEFRTERAEIDIDANTAWGDQPIEGQGPLGILKRGHVSPGQRDRPGCCSRAACV